MATSKKTTVKGFQSAPAKTAAADDAPRSRNRVDDQSAAMARAVAGASDVDDSVENGPKVLVNVPRGFILTDDGHNQHAFKSGQQMMLEVHADHAYSIANGVTKVAD